MVVGEGGAAARGVRGRQEAWGVYAALLDVVEAAHEVVVGVRGHSAVVAVGRVGGDKVADVRCGRHEPPGRAVRHERQVALELAASRGLHAQPVEVRPHKRDETSKAGLE